MHHYWNGWVPLTGLIDGTARYPEGDYNEFQNPHGQVFNVESIGRERYNSICVTITRALKRLEQRHLLFEVGRGRSLTDHGLEVVKKVSNGTQT